MGEIITDRIVQRFGAMENRLFVGINIYGSRDGHGARMIFSRAAREIAEEIIDDDDSGMVEVLLPRTMMYRITEQLNLIQRACALADVDPEHLFLITSGAGMVKEGVNIKTSDHQFPPTAMTIIGRPKTWHRMHYQQL